MEGEGSRVKGDRWRVKGFVIYRLVGCILKNGFRV